MLFPPETARGMRRAFPHMNPWKYAENTFLVVTTGNFKLMNILISDHAARIAQAVTAVNPPDSDFTTMQGRLTPVKTVWDTAYNAWIAARGTYKGKTQALETKLADLSGLRIKQWDIVIQGVFLDGTPEYTQLLPNGRGPFQQGAYDLRIAEVKALQTRLAPFTGANPTLTALATTVGTFHTEIKGLRDSQQGQEGAVDTASTGVEAQRIASGNAMYQNLGRLMEKFVLVPTKIEDYYDMSYIRDGAVPPPAPPPVPPVP